jgi:FHA domain
MTGDVLEKALRRVRVLNGPQRGATHLVRERLGIGRASASDIQLVHDGISRQHAQIVTDEQGRHVLVDLDSSNGTFIDGQRIRRQVLAPGTIFKIMRVKLVYETVVEEPVDCEDSGVFAVRRLDRETLRGTVDYGELDLPQPATPRPRVASETGPVVMSAEVDAYADAEDGRAMARRTGRTASAPAAQARGEERHRIVATRSDGSVYEGSLIDDIIEYRELRVRIDRGDPVTTAERRTFDGFEERLRAPEPEARDPADGRPGQATAASQSIRRDFNRFGCHFPAKLRFSTGDEVSAAVLDLGVDGTRLRVYDHQIEHDAIVWLAIHLVSRGRAHTVVFTGRVAWTCRDHLGLGFAGAPGWEHLGHRKVAIRTHMDLGEQLRAARATLGRMQLRDRRTSS